MKKLSFVVLVLLLVSVVGYGENGWTDAGTVVRLDDNDDSVGIGTSSPEKKLHVVGDIKIPVNKIIYFGNAKIEGYTDYYQGLKFYGNSTSSPLITMHGGGNVGIGTASPAGKLHIVGNSIITGNVGIGTTNPLAKFTIYNPNPYNTSDGSYERDHILFETDDAELEVGNLFGGITWKSSGRRRAGIAATREGTDADIIGIAFLTQGTNGPGDFYESMRIAHSGNVGIGTTNPGSYKLAVNGHIRTKEITVESGWSDFVFEDNYKLMPLDKLEKHIKSNKSLPGIPTEKEVAENGIEVGEMQAKLLEKVEELTLYVIDLKKENEKLQKRIDALEK
jgi:hypothetical protein